MRHEPQRWQEFGEARFPFPQHALVIGKEQKVVHVAHVGDAFQFAFDKLIEFVQIHICPELRRKIADRQTARTITREQIITGEPLHHVLPDVDIRAAGENLVDQPERPFIGKRTREQIAQNRVINRRKELHNIALQDVAIAARKLLGAVERAVRALAFAIGVGIVDELALKDRLDDIA